MCLIPCIGSLRECPWRQQLAGVGRTDYHTITVALWVKVPKCPSSQGRVTGVSPHQTRAQDALLHLTLDVALKLHSLPPCLQPISLSHYQLFIGPSIPGCFQNHEPDHFISQLASAAFNPGCQRPLALYRLTRSLSVLLRFLFCVPVFCPVPGA